MSVFACDECKSPAFAIGGKLTDATEVRCDDCGALLGSWAEFRQHLERSLSDGFRLYGTKPARAPRRKRAVAGLA